MEIHRAYIQNRENPTDRGRHQVTINVLPDDVLLDIFDFYLNQRYIRTSAWQRLVHVCNRWRAVVLQSFRRLNLQINCTVATPVKEMLDIWPPLPFVISVRFNSRIHGMENVITALVHRDRVHKISVDGTSLETILPVMQEPFPALSSLRLRWPDGEREPAAPCIPDSFLGGSVPHLRYLHLSDIPFPALPELLLSATDLVTLNIQNVPHSGYISPEAMVTALSALTSLESFDLIFKSPESRPDRESRHSPSLTRAVLPALTRLVFQGVSEYLEDLVVWIDAVPLLDRLEVYFFNRAMFHTPHLFQFISRIPKFQALNDAQVVVFVGGRISVNVPSQQILGDQVITMGPVGPVGTGNLGWRPMSLAQLCVSSLTLFHTVENLYLTGPFPHRRDTQNTQWLEFLHPFTAVKNLYLSRNFALLIAPALEELDIEGAAEMLPVLQKIFLEEQTSEAAQQAIKQFVKARRLSSYPIVVYQWTQERSSSLPRDSSPVALYPSLTEIENSTSGRRSVVGQRSLLSIPLTFWRRLLQVKSHRSS